jgi:hypothetical protein
MTDNNKDEDFELKGDTGITWSSLIVEGYFDPVMSSVVPMEK